eukprot:Rhum_TRINITY_DN15204_c1_g1::Rhum_TRINITY_DN15204_c1_g1_i1::g.143625::m.143625
MSCALAYSKKPATSVSRSGPSANRRCCASARSRRDGCVLWMTAVAMRDERSTTPIGFTLSAPSVSRRVLGKVFVAATTTCTLASSSSIAPHRVRASSRSRARRRSRRRSSASNSSSSASSCTRDLLDRLCHESPGRTIVGRRQPSLSRARNAASIRCGMLATPCVLRVPRAGDGPCVGPCAGSTAPNAELSAPNNPTAPGCAAKEPNPAALVEPHGGGPWPEAAAEAAAEAAGAAPKPPAPPPPPPKVPPPPKPLPLTTPDAPKVAPPPPNEKPVATASGGTPLPTPRVPLALQRTTSSLFACATSSSLEASRAALTPATCPFTASTFTLHATSSSSAKGSSASYDSRSAATSWPMNRSSSSSVKRISFVSAPAGRFSTLSSCGRTCTTHIANSVSFSCIPRYAFTNACCSGDSCSTRSRNSFAVGMLSISSGMTSSSLDDSTSASVGVNTSPSSPPRVPSMSTKALNCRARAVRTCCGGAASLNTVCTYECT